MQASNGHWELAYLEPGRDWDHLLYRGRASPIDPALQRREQFRLFRVRAGRPSMMMARTDTAAAAGAATGLRRGQWAGSGTGALRGEDGKFFHELLRTTVRALDGALPLDRAHERKAAAAIAMTDRLA